MAPGILERRDSQAKDGPKKKSKKDSKKAEKPIRILPVTVLSGFLGSGKTTLLERILKSREHGLRIAVIVNDMADVNVDGATINRASSKAANKPIVVEMQNGCICCTLRADLLVELGRLAQQDKFDYVVIESSGISEPMQVAESFTAELAEAMELSEEVPEEDMAVINKIAKMGGLQSVSKIDTMATVVDAFRFFSEFDTAEFLADRFGEKLDVPEDDMRTVSDLFADQIEFANVIIINKIDIVDQATRDRVRSYVKALNPKAKIIEAEHAKIDVKEILNTRSFDIEEAHFAAGWMQSVNDMDVINVNGKRKLAPKPETLEYGINSFVYRARKPFDPAKLHKLIEKRFVLLQPDEDEGADEDDDEDKTSEDGDADMAEAEEFSEQDNTTEDKPGQWTDYDSTEIQEILENKRTDPLFSKVHRSKGTIWFATRPDRMGSWSSAGAMLSVSDTQNFFCAIPEDQWAVDGNEAGTLLIKNDFVGEWGDRRQEIVFIGESVDKDGLTKALNECLITDDEMKAWEEIMRSRVLVREEQLKRLAELWNEDDWEEWGDGADQDEEWEDEEDDEGAASKHARHDSHHHHTGFKHGHRH